MAVTLSLFAGAGAQFFDNSGIPLAGGKIYTYAAGTTTPAPTYTTVNGNVFHTNPIVLDSAGRLPSGGELWLPIGVGYKFVLKTSTEVLVATYDNIPSAAQAPAANDADSIMYEQGYTVTAGSFVVGKIYRIVSIGTTDFTLIGATSNTVGLHFVATGVGAGTGTAELSQTVETKLRQYVSVKDFGAVGDGVTNDTTAFKAAIAASTSIYVPQGTYLIEPTATSGDFMLYLGTQGSGGNPTSRNGMHIYGDGNTSIIKLGNNVGRGKVLFGGAVGDSFANMRFENLAFDMNGANNLQTSFSDPLRLNSAFYFFCPCDNITFENLYIYDFSGSQAIRVGNDTSSYGANIKILNCRVNNFGIGLTNNFQQDVSVFYIQADGILIDGCWFQNSDFTFDLSRGQTAMELHGANSTIVTNNRFSYTQLPVLIVSSANPNYNVLVDNNVMIECAYLASLDSAELDQKRITISNNIFQSTKATASGIIGIGNNVETAKVREDVFIIGNTINCFGNTNRLVNLIYCENAYLRSIVIQDNIVGGLLGSLLYFAGVVRNTGFCDIVIKNNRLDSLGNVGGSIFPTFPTFIFVSPSSGTVNALTIDGNQFFNSSAKDYSGLGLIRVGGNINYLTIENNEVSAVNAAYPVTTQSSLVTLIRLIQAGFYMPVDYRTGPTTVSAGGTVNLYDFTAGNGWGNNDNALLTVQLWIGDGGTTNNTIQFLNIGWSSSGGNVTTASNFGTYSANISVSFSGTTLRISNSSGTALSLYWNVKGLTTKPITFLI
jgi:hypothetical protein